MSKVPIAIINPVLLTDIHQELAYGGPGVTVVRNIRAVNTGKAPARLYLCKGGHDMANAWHWATIIPGDGAAPLDENVFKALVENETLEAWADVPGVLCLSIDGTIQPAV